MTRARDLADSADKDIAGTLTLDGLDVAGNVSVDGGTIKLDGNYPVGTGNVALGNAALDDGSLSGNFNTAMGNNALTANTSGASNTAIGAATGQAITTGNYNTAIGSSALVSNTTASNNTAVGYQAGYSNTTGTNSVYIGYQSGDAVTTASSNTFVGRSSGTQTTLGGSNTFIGEGSGNANVTGTDNTFVGQDAGSTVTGSKNTIIGCHNGNQGGLDIRTSSNNIVLSDGDGNPRCYWDANGMLNQAINYNSYRVARFENTNNTAGNGAIFTRLGTNCFATTSYHFVANTAGIGDACYIHGNGNIVNYNNSYGSLSDVKLKENIVDAASQWDDIKAITVRKYSMKVENLDAPNKLGVIAQELEAAGMSGLVSETQDRDDDGNVLGTVTKTVNYSILYMKAVKALQEAMDRIETLEAKVTALENV